MSQSANETITVLIADDHPIYREGVAEAIRRRPGFDLVAECADGDEALAAIRAQRPRVAVLDLRLPGLSAIQIAEQLRGDGSETELLVLTAYAESDVVYEAVTAGVSGYMTKDEDRARICDAVAAVARGNSVFSPSAQAGLAGEIRRHDGAARLHLTDREREVLTLVARGRSSPEIGRELNIGATTVKSHLQTLYEKLGVNDRAAAVAEAMRRGLIH